MTQDKKPPFRADHVGSLLRPPELAAARAKAKAGTISAEEQRLAEDAAIRDAVALQEAAGLESITDGEFRRDYWHLDFLSGFDGAELWEAQRTKAFSNDEQPPMIKIVGKVSRGTPIFVDHFRFLKSVTTRTPKITIPGPSLIHLRPGNEAIDPAAYAHPEDFWADLCAGYRQEIADFAAAGCTYLQIDDISYAYLCDDAMRQMIRDRGDDPEDVLKLYVRLFNEVVRDLPAGMTTAVHMCRGNFKSSWVAQGGYEPVAAACFGGMNADAFFLEYDSDRAGGFEPLRHLADGKTVVLGLVSSKVPELEGRDDLKRRVEEATTFVPLDRLCLSPQCGFSSTHHGNAVTVEDEKAKLGLVVDTAREIWG